MITSRLKFAAAGALGVRLAVAGLGFVPRGVPGAQPTARAVEPPSSVDVSLRITAPVPEDDPPQPPAKAEAQPNFLAFGSVRVGATVEGSIRIFRETASASGLAVKYEPPSFLRVNDLKVGAQEYGPNTRGFCDLSLSVDTSRPGNYSGDLLVEIGRQQAAVRVSVTVRPQMPNLTRLLVVSSPFSKFSTSDATTFAPWLEEVSEGHLDPHYLEVQRGMPVLGKIDLTKIDVVLLGMEGLFFLQDSDTKLLKQFMERGGRSILAANYFFRGTVAKANELLVDYGLRMTDAENPRQPEFELGPGEIAADPLTHGVKKLYFHRPSPVVVTDPEKGKILVATPGEPGKGFVAVARAGRGEVIALGTSLWWDWVSRDKTRGSDNGALMANLLQKSAKRK